MSAASGGTSSTMPSWEGLRPRLLSGNEALGLFEIGKANRSWIVVTEHSSLVLHFWI